VSKKTPVWQRLSGQASLFIGGIILVFLLTGGALLMVISNQYDREKAVDIQQERACRAASTIGDYLQARQYVLGLVAQQTIQSEAGLQPLLASISQVYPELIEVTVLDPEGETIAATEHHTPVLNHHFTIQQSNWFTSALEGQQHLSDVYISPQDQPYIILAVSVMQAEEVIGVVAARLSMDALWQTSETIDVGQNGIVYFTNQRNTIIAYPDRSLIMQTAEQIPNQGIYQNLQDEEVVGAGCSIPGTEWTAIAELPSDRAIGEASASRLSTWAIFVALTVSITALLGWQMAQYIIRPLQKLRFGVQEVGQGNFHHRLHIHRKDEIGDVARGFDEMAFQLFARSVELKEWELYLGERVEERTQELSAANARMEAIAEALYQATQRANAANLAKSQFLANMSHELRTPVNSILLYHDLLLRNAYGELNEKQRDRLSKASASTHHLLDLINDVLDLSKIEAGEMTFDHSRVDVQDLVNSTRDFVEPLLRKEVEFTIEVVPGTQPILGDAQRTKQVILNLLSNAAKFTEKGKIALKAWSFKVKEGAGMPDGFGTLSDGCWVAIAVQDTGIGIAPEHQAGIFEAFKQVDESNTRKYGGTGLGLAISKQFIEAQKGHLYLTSEPEVGSIFTFVLPAANLYAE
jgi:signal transduction histidine kinase